MLLMDLEMPENCRECFAREVNYCHAKLGKRINTDIMSKSEWCPIKGELDQDTLNKILKYNSDADISFYSNELSESDMDNLIKFTRVIVEAEGEE